MGGFLGDDGSRRLRGLEEGEKSLDAGGGADADSACGVQRGDRLMELGEVRPALCSQGLVVVLVLLRKTTELPCVDTVVGSIAANESAGLDERISARLVFVIGYGWRSPSHQSTANGDRRLDW